MVKQIFAQNGSFAMAKKALLHNHDAYSDSRRGVGLKFIHAVDEVVIEWDYRGTASPL